MGLSKPERLIYTTWVNFTVMLLIMCIFEALSYVYNVAIKPKNTRIDQCSVS